MKDGTSSARATIRSRDQLIVGYLAQALNGVDATEARPRARALPAMFQRHGALQVFVFLASKDSAADQKVGRVILRVLSELSPDSPLTRFPPFGSSAGDTATLADIFQLVADQRIEQRLYDQALCIEVASWLARTLDAISATDAAAAEVLKSDDSASKAEGSDER